MPATTTRILRRTAMVSAALTLAGAPVALARPADQGPAPAATQNAPVTIVGHRVPDALSMQDVPSAADQPTTIVGHRVPDALSMQDVPSAQPAGDSGSVDSTPWIIAAAGLAGLGLAGGGVQLAKRRGGVRLSRGHVGV
jgi:hypothetical protein